MTTLQNIKNQLAAARGLTISERGTGKGTFLYIRSINRAVEVSIEGIDHIIEYWATADEESDDAPVNRDVVSSETDALIKIKNWLAA